MAYRATVIPAGFNQATAAMQAVLRGAVGSAGSRSRRGPSRVKRGTRIARKRRAASTTRRKRSRVRRATRSARLVKGSAAAKRYMAKLRKMVKRRRA